MKRLLLIGILLAILQTVVAVTPADGWIGRDKVLHLLGSAAITYAGTTLGHDAGDRHAALWAVGVSISLGCSKEASDRYIRKTMWSWKDLAYDVLGTGLGLIAYQQLR